MLLDVLEWLFNNFEVPTTLCRANVTSTCAPAKELMVTDWVFNPRDGDNAYIEHVGMSDCQVSAASKEET